MLRQFKAKIELYQLCVSEFIPDKISGVALEYRPRESAILEEDEEYETTSYN
jgi:hypothetical protein